MAWGAKIMAPNGAVQFDSTWPALCFKGKGSIASSVGSQTVIVTSGQAPMIAFRPIGCNAAIAAAGKTGSTYTFTFAFYGSASGTLEYFIYDKPPTSRGTAGYALVLQDENGVITFDSRFPPMRIVSGAQPSGRKWAIVPPIGPMWSESVDLVLDSWGNATGEIVWRTAIGGWEFDGSQFFMQPFSTGSHFGLSSDNSYDPSQSARLLVDVTNL